MYGSIFIHICAVGSKWRIFSLPTESTRVRFGRSRSFRPSWSSKVNDFGTTRKRVYKFLLVGHCDYSHILHRFRDMVTYWLKICLFLLPLSHSALSLPMFPLEFRGEVNRQETSHGTIRHWRPHDHSWSRFGMIPACDGRTVRRTVKQNLYADAL